MKNFPRNQVTHYDTFDAFMEGIEKEFGDRPAISWFLRNKTEMCRSFRETAEDVRQLKEALYHRGLAGKNIALVGENSYDWIITYLAVAASGGIAVQSLLQVVIFRITDFASLGFLPLRSQHRHPLLFSGFSSEIYHI